MLVVVSSSSNEKRATDRVCPLWYRSLTHASYIVSDFRAQEFCPYFCVYFMIYEILAVDIIVWERVKQGQTAAHSFFLPKSTPAGDRIMQDLLGCWMGAAALLRVRLHSEHLLINNTCVDLPVCPTCSLPSCTKKGQREISFVFPSWHASTAGLKGRPEPFEGGI